jgi:CDP-paratose 2-epimerase
VTVVVTGGAGFVGTNLADRLLCDGRRVTVLDSLARPGVEENLRWLEARHGDRLRFVLGDVRDPAAVREALHGAEAVFHFAAQVAVTTSLDDPRQDFDVNLLGTLTVLEELRRRPPVPLLFTSTNKVYGSLPDVELERLADRWLPCDRQLGERGVDETRPLAFSTPYGCSKGGADQYVLDYAKTFGLPAVVFRMSCIYGDHQHGNEDQGWVAHFVLRALAGHPLTVYGDGAQVRDVLHARDLVEAMVRVHADAERLAGRAFNVGGGPEHTLSLLELLDLLEELGCPRPETTFADERPGDQRWYVSDHSALAQAVAWRPRVGVEEGVESLQRWLARGAEAAPAAAHAG